MVKFSGCVVVSMAVLLGACETTGSKVADYQELYAPAIGGQLLRQGVPVAGAALVLSLVDSPRDNCHFEHRRGVTDADGRFYFDGLTRDDVPQYVGDLDHQWQLCLDEDDVRRSLWHDRQVGLLLPSASVVLECELSRDPAAICRAPATTE